MSEYRIITFTLTDSHRYGNILEQLLRLRYKAFILEEKYDVPSYNGMEFDQYDNPFAKYIAIMKGSDVIACSRMNRTDIPYMAKDFWSEYISEEFLPSDANIFEVTRVYSDSALSAHERLTVSRIIISVTYFLALKLNISKLCYVTYPTLYNATKRLGMNVDSVARIDLPDFPNLHFVHVHVKQDDAENIATNLFASTGFDVVPHFEYLGNSMKN